MDDHTLTIRLDYKGLTISYRIAEECLEQAIYHEDVIADIAVDLWNKIKFRLT